MFRELLIFCICVYVLGCRLSSFRLCDSDFEITAVDDITNGITWAVIIIIIIIIIINTIIITILFELSFVDDSSPQKQRLFFLSCHHAQSTLA
jgi:hypothetical protein